MVFIVAPLPPLVNPEWTSLYEYTSDLLCLDFCRPSSEHQCQALIGIRTPLCAAAWDRALVSHPDRAFTHHVSQGLHQGSRIGFNHRTPLKSAASNTGSAHQHPTIISEYIDKELSLGHMLGPFQNASALPPIHINWFGVIPKGHNTGKWRLITDFSFPPSQSINDGIDPSLCSLSYISVDQVADIATQYGRGVLLAKVDIESPYRLIPVHPQDCPLLAVVWDKAPDNQIFIDPMLLFGLRSAPKIFNAVADALNWYLHQCGIPHVLHYLLSSSVPRAPPSVRSPCQLWTGCAWNLAYLLPSIKETGLRPASCSLALR